MNSSFTGERVLEGHSPHRIWLDHVARYELASHYVKGKVVLDIACGSGYGSKLLRDGGASEVFGVDISPEVISFALSRYEDKKVDFAVGDVLDIHFPSNYFDVVVCFETIEHVKEQERALAELLRVLKSGGLLIMSSPNRKLTSPGKSAANPPDNPYHVMEYSTKEFVSALSHSVEILEVYGQRSKPKLLFSPFFERILRFCLPGLYDPESGDPELKRLRPFKEYRYVTVVCRKIREKGINENLSPDS